MDIYIVIAVLTTSVFMVDCEGPVVDTTLGKIKGKVLKTLIGNVEYFGFMGVPYAAPPVKDLRFMPPQPITPWEEVLPAVKEKRACLQNSYRLRKDLSFGVYGMEDCLYLDIFTPNIDTDQRAVIVFLFNENFVSSYNKSKDYAPDFFIEEEVVVVTISHRLSTLGFLTFEDETLPGNAGLKDIVEALRWVKSNIDRFGGNPNKLTLMGSQGGAIATDLLLNSNAKDLINAAILQSGTAYTTECLQEETRSRAFKLGELLGFSTSSPTNLLNFLRNISGTALLERDIHASPDDYSKENQRFVVSFGPVVEKYPNGLITEYPEYSKMKIHIPIMIGFNSQEGLQSSLEYLIEPRYLTFFQKDFPFLLPMRLKFKLDPIHDDYYKAIEDIKSFYFNGDRIGTKHTSEVVKYFGDVTTAFMTDYAAKIYSSRSDKPVYYYFFDYFSDLNENKNNIMKISTVNIEKGAASGDELCYLLKCPNLKSKYLGHSKVTSDIWSVQKKMVRMWANFAKYGNPTPEGDDLLDNLKWNPYNNSTKEYLHIDQHMEVKSNLYKDRIKFWEEFIQKWEHRASTFDVNSGKAKDEL